MMHHIFHVWEVGGSVPCLQLATCDSRSPKEMSDHVNDVFLKQVMEEVLVRVTCDDPIQGNWNISGEELNAWVDVSSLATGVVLERHGDILEEACLLRSTNNTQHINLAELEQFISTQTPCVSTIG